MKDWKMIKSLPLGYALLKLKMWDEYAINIEEYLSEKEFKELEGETVDEFITRFTDKYSLIRVDYKFY